MYFGERRMSTGTLDASIGRRFIGYKVERSSDSSCEITIGIARIRKKTVEKRSFLFSCGDPTLYQILQTILYLIIKLIRFRDLLFL